MFRQYVPTKQFSQATKPFSAFGADIRKRHWLSSLPTKRHKAPPPEPETANADDQLHPGFCLHPGRPLDTGSSDGSLPGVGTFSYNSSPAFTVVAGN